jgi:hypothetical protein
MSMFGPQVELDNADQDSEVRAIRAQLSQRIALAMNALRVDAATQDELTKAVRYSVVRTREQVPQALREFIERGEAVTRSGRPYGSGED